MARIKEDLIATGSSSEEMSYGPDSSPHQSIQNGRNARIALNIFRGKKGPHRDIVLLNAACALYAGGVARTIRQGLALAVASIDSGAAHEKLRLLKRASKGGM